MSRQLKPNVPVPVQPQDAEMAPEETSVVDAAAEAPKDDVTPPAPAPVAEKPQPIHVMATRAGFYKLERKVEGDKFTIDGKHHLGKWMKPI